MMDAAGGKDRAETERALESLLRVRPDHPSYRAACAEAVRLAAALEVVRLEFESFISSFIRSGPEDPGEIETFYLLGRLYMGQGFTENAREAFRKVLGASPGYRDTPSLLAAFGAEARGELPDLPELPQLPDPARAPARTPGRDSVAPKPQPADEHAPAFVVGATIADRYRLDERIGHGGMSVVFRATDLELGDTIALKVFTQAVYDEETDGRFKRELRLSRQLSHPNIVRLFDIGLYRGFRYISMELLVGSDLRQRMSSPLPVAEGIDCLIQACAGLQAAHDRGIVHRDIKPENCFITKQGVLKLMDFGIAKVQSAPGLTTTGMIAGTPVYMSPEQIRDFSGVTPAADLYALGVVAYEMFTGRVPFMHAELMSLFLMHSNEPPAPPRNYNPEIPEPLERAILTLLEKQPARRFASARELAERLEAVRRERA